MAQFIVFKGRITVMEVIHKIFRWIFTHKKVVFVYIPVAIALLSVMFILFIFVLWQQDRDGVLKRLNRYKLLIDRTEELKKGYAYTYTDVDLKAKVVDIPTRIYDRKNEIIGEFFEQKREIVPYDFIPEWLIKAVIASEDRNFYTHHGISYRGILRAFLTNLIHFRVVQGGSTITQQLAKVLFTDMERNVKRKIYEAFCAKEIEKRYDKQDILSMYLNLIYFGNGAYGIESASKMFFGTSVRELSPVECAVVVATISNPKIYSPLSDLDASMKKTRRILESLVDAGFNESGKATSSLIGNFIYSSYRVNRAPFFNEGIRRVLVEKFGEEVVKKGGLKVLTTMDAEKQDIASRALKAAISRQREYHQNLSVRMKNRERAERESAKAQNIEGAFVSINPDTGEIITYVGGYEFSSKNQNDHVAQIRRQPGSSFKPIVYAAAIESKDVTPSSVFIDEKTTFKGGYQPRNYDGEYGGEVIVREALKKSINVVSVKILEKTGYEGVFSIVRKGLYLTDDDMKERFGRTLSLALGSYELSPLESCVLHAIIENGGEYVIPYGIRQVKDYTDNIVWNNEEEVKKTINDRRKDLGKIIDPIACAITINMLRSVFEQGGTAYAAVQNKKINFQIAGKTGTTTNYSDAWFAGCTSNLVSTVWIGNREGSISLGQGRAGGAIAVPVWIDFIMNAYKGDTPADFRVPDQGVSVETICLDSGEVAGRNGECPRVARGQLYYSGTEPGKYCHIHVAGDRPRRGDKETEEEGKKE
jgi:membrane carboxypeptidase/penicillin-binding protein